MPDKLLKECEESMEKRVKAFESDLSKVRTGRASINILDNIKVNYYETLTPLNQVATLTTPDARTINIAPFEKNLIPEIEKAIQKADLGLQPTNDGKLVRLSIPQLTEERRKEIVKSLKKLTEAAKVSVRHIRRDYNEDIKVKEKSKDIGEDESKKLQTDIQKLTDKFVKVIDDKSAAKEKDILTI